MKIPSIILVDAVEKEGLKASHLNSVHHQQAVAYGSEQSDLNRIDSSQQYQVALQAGGLSNFFLYEMVFRPPSQCR